MTMSEIRSVPPRPWRHRLRGLALAAAVPVLAAVPTPSQAAILSFFGFGFSKNAYYKEAQYWVSKAGDVLGLVGVIAPPAASLGAVIRTGAVIARVIDPPATTIISGRATIALSPGETFVQGGWYGEFGADPFLPAPSVGSLTLSQTLLQADCNPTMLSCGTNYDAMTHTVVMEFDWGSPGFTPTLNLDASGHFNFAAVYTLSDAANVPFGMVGTHADVLALGTAAPTYMLCNSGYCGSIPVPGPSSWAVLVAGLAGLAMATRRRQQLPPGATPA
ncbi:hypothetical protein ACI6QG_00740 [Roseococcus sp. DSY-14]|uniref:hypothetical protein n=1 Tax=Roseococcus sp. DSY-14 TaxID=3369650 RepID=UPI00387B16A9